MSRRMFKTTALILTMLSIATGGVVVFLIWGKQIEEHLQPEVFKLSFEFLLVVVVGGAVSLLYEQFSAERELRQKRRDLLRQMHAELLKAFNDAKRIRRKLRAHVGYKSGRAFSPESKVRSAEYKEAMEAIIDAQLTFEVYAKRAEDTQLWFASGEGLAVELRKIEVYLNEIIDEYQEKANSFVEIPSGKALAELPVLAEFIGPVIKDQKFDAEFKNAFRNALEKLDKAELA